MALVVCLISWHHSANAAEQQRRLL